MRLVSTTLSPYGPRNLSFLNSRVILYIRYNKSRSVLGYDQLIPKALPREVSFVVMKYLALVVPVLLLTCKSRFGEGELLGKAIRRYSYYLFTRSGMEFSAHNVRDAIKDVTTRYFGFKMEVLEYRHFVKAVLMQFYGLNPDMSTKAEEGGMGENDADEEEEDPFSIHRTFGHSARTARRYAVTSTSNPFEQLYPSKFEKSLHVSMVWGSFMMVTSLPPCSITQIQPGASDATQGTIEETMKVSF